MQRKQRISYAAQRVVLKGNLTGARHQCHRATMAEINKLDAAFARFEQALGKFESAMGKNIAETHRLQQVAGEAAVMQRDQLRLNKELDQVRVKAAELVDTSKQAAGKIDTAVGRIRSVLHSNSGA
jgi:predicted  nucleic acid-binding Zn-ribbon protein